MLFNSGYCEEGAAVLGVQQVFKKQWVCIELNNRNLTLHFVSIRMKGAKFLQKSMDLESLSFSYDQSCKLFYIEVTRVVVAGRLEDPH